MMRTGATLVVVAAAIALAAACSEATAPTVVAPGDDLVNDSNNTDAAPMPAPPPDSDAQADASMDTGIVYTDGSYAPMLNTCAACSCSATKGFCFAGGVHLSGGPDAQPACAMVTGSTVEDGCNSLPAACAANPTCDCVLTAVQPQFQCYLVCSPDNGYLLVYCPNGS